MITRWIVVIEAYNMVAEKSNAQLHHFFLRSAKAKQKHARLKKKKWTHLKKESEGMN